MISKNKNNVVLLIAVMLSFTLTAQSPILHLDFNQNNFEQSTTEQITGQELFIQNHFERPERITANFGNAIRLDGFSTFISEENIELNYDTAFSVESWYATEAHSKEFSSIVEQIDDQGGFKLQVGPFGRIRFTFFFGSTERTLTTNQRINKYQWNHIVASVDGVTGEANIYVNGENWLLHNFTENSVISPSQGNLWIGKSSLNQLFSGFSINTLNGAIDDLKIYDYALPENDVIDHYNAATSLDVHLHIDPSDRHRNDYLRPNYHAMPNTSWTNECYGLTYYDDKYHLFFQKNPNGPYLYFMHWGHLSSPDLITWNEEKIALAPSFGFDDFGTWSGTTIFDSNNEPVIFYTGVDGAKAGIGSAYPVDSTLVDWEKSSNNPLIANPPLGFPNKDFRDPFIFFHDSLYYMVVGSGLANDGGGILFSYRSSDLENWELIPPIWESSDISNHGHFWEMPTMIPLDNNNYFVQITPLYHGNPANSIYWIGTFDGEEFTPNFEIGKPLEHIDQNLLAPAFGQDENGEWTYIGIIPEDRNIGDQIQAGWRHTFSIPRVIRLLDNSNTIGVIPHPNICRLRKDSVVVENRIVNANEVYSFSDFETQQGELEILVDFEQSQRIEINVFKSPSTGNHTKIVLDKTNERIALDRTQSSPHDSNEDFRSQNYIFNSNGEVKLRIFLDHSTIEVFVDNLISFSDRVYPDEDGKNIDFQGDDSSFVIQRIVGYQLGNKMEEYEDVQCSSSFLPSDLYTSSNEIYPVSEIKLFPNPVESILIFDSVNPQKITILNMNGNRVLQSKAVNQLDISHLSSGVYFLHLQIEKKLYVEKIIKI